MSWFPPQFTQITVLQFGPLELFKETGSALDVHSMAGSSRTGLLITMIGAFKTGLGVVAYSSHNTVTQ